MFNWLKEKINFPWIFCFSMIIIFIFVFLLAPNIGIEAWLYFVNLIKKIIPILFIVFILIFISNLVLQPKTIIKYLGANSGFKGWLIAIGGGILSSGPIYMWYPLLADLKKNGTRDGLLAAFIYNRAIKIPLMPMLIYYFNWPFVIILTFYMIIFSIINGLIVEKFLHNNSNKLTQTFAKSRVSL